MPLMTTLDGPGELAGALRAVDGLPALTARYGALVKDGPTDVARSGREIVHDAALALAAGRPVDLTEVAGQVDHAERDARRGAHAQEIHNRAVTFLSSEIDAATRAGLDAAFAYLRRRLGEILDSARRVSAAVSPTATAEAILRAGDAQLRAWRELDELAAAYRQVRGAQTTLTKIGLGDQVTKVSAMVTAHGEIRGRDLLWTRPVGDSPLTGTVAGPPWPHQPGTDQPTYSAGYLAWLVTADDVDVWLPLPHELREEAAAAYQRQQDAEQSRYPAAARAL